MSEQENRLIARIKERGCKLLTSKCMANKKKNRAKRKRNKK